MTTELTIIEQQDRMLKVLAETIQYYCEDPRRRAVTADGECRYYDGETDNCCAVGRCLIDPVDHEGMIGTVDELFDPVDYGEDETILKKEYRGLPIRFWMELQDWHDDDGRWRDHEEREPLSRLYNRQHCCDDTHPVAVRAQELRDRINDGYYTQAN